MDRLDALIKVTRERASEGRGINDFDRLYHSLRNMCSDKEALEMERKWFELQKEISLDKWDEAFLTAVAGDNDKDDEANNLFYTGSGAYTFTQNHTTYTQLNQESLVKAVIEMQKQKQMAELQLEREKAELEKEIQKAELENVRLEARTCK
jgi:ureidoglycolate hydrolase